VEAPSQFVGEQVERLGLLAALSLQLDKGAGHVRATYVRAERFHVVGIAARAGANFENGGTRGPTTGLRLADRWW
jgi:hypothetical protein